VNAIAENRTSLCSVGADKFSATVFQAIPWHHVKAKPDEQYNSCNGCKATEEELYRELIT
jgi:hypothetical protein